MPAGRGTAVRTGWGEVSKWKRANALYAVITVVVAVVIVIAAIGIAEELHHSGGSSSVVLVKQGTTDLVPAGQFDAVTVNAKAASTINGSVAVIYEVVLYTMTSQQVLAFAKTLVVSGDLWTSGPIENVSRYAISVPVSAGSSYFVFANPGAVESLVGFNSALTLESV